mmetsp:Transcript_12592/g.30046  ORF Transcript_12592/g.30046 Transcript_12592/m.30046 type:complete len:477 (-) Transcript_12592:536-1966(-)
MSQQVKSTPPGSPAHLPEHHTGQGGGVPAKYRALTGHVDPQGQGGSGDAQLEVPHAEEHLDHALVGPGAPLMVVGNAALQALHQTLEHLFLHPPRALLLEALDLLLDIILVPTQRLLGDEVELGVLLVVRVHPHRGRGLVHHHVGDLLTPLVPLALVVGGGGIAAGALLVQRQLPCLVPLLVLLLAPLHLLLVQELAVLVPVPLVVLGPSQLLNHVVEHLLDLCSVQVEDQSGQEPALVELPEDCNQRFPVRDLPPVPDLLQLALQVRPRALLQIHVRELPVLLQGRGALQRADDLRENFLGHRVASHKLIELGYQRPLIVAELRLGDGDGVSLPEVRHGSKILDRRHPELLLQGGEQLHSLPRGQPQIPRHPLLLHPPVGQHGERMQGEQGASRADVVVQIVPALTVLDHDRRGRPLLLGHPIEPLLEELRVGHRSGQGQERALDHLQQMLPLHTALRLSDTVNLIEDHELDTAH